MHGEDELQASLDLTPSTQGETQPPDACLPPIVPPATKLPSQFNQQVNINQIPPRVWDKLTSDQIVTLSSSIMEQVERMDNRRFEVAKQQATAAAKNSQLSILVGGSVAVCGFALVGFLSSNGNGVVAGTVGGFLATIIAVVVGRKLSD